MASQLKSGDKALLAILTLAAMAGGWWYLDSDTTAEEPDGLVVVCQSKDGFRRVDALDSDARYVVETPGTGLGADAEAGTNTVSIHGGEVDVIESNCHNQVCADHDPISSAGEQIVCLPHGVVIEIVEDEAQATSLA